MSNPKPLYGGQAVIEGVMMGGKHTTVTAIRRKDDTIDYFEIQKKPNKFLSNFKRIPFLRGLVGILEASALGTKHLNFSSERYDIDPEEDAELIKDEKEGNKLSVILGVAAIGILSFLFAKFIFTLVPAFLANFLTPIFPGFAAQILIEGAFKIALLLGYIYFVSLTPLMKRVFEYHGAEHKVINTYENNQPLTVNNVKENSRLHYRCGSSYILFTAIISILLYFFVPKDPLSLRVFYRIILIPVDLGIAYEALQLTNNARHIPFLKWLGYPGLWLQLLTTKEPDAKQIEIAISAFEEMKRREEVYEGTQTSSKIV